MSEGKLIIIVAPSGSGKSTLISKLKKDFPVLVESVSYTTRPVRDGEVNGTHYNFIDKNQFEALKDQGEFLEWAKVHGNYYGTSKSFVEKSLEEGSKLLFDLDVQGTDSFKDYFKDKANIIFISPPSIEELEKRLRGRGTESEEAITTRVNNAKKEILRKNDYNYCVVNDDFENAYQNLKQIFSDILDS